MTTKEPITTLDMSILDANSAWFGVPASELMENAGRATAKEANKFKGKIVVLCGPGNNGGDAFVSCRYLKSKPKIFYLKRPKGVEALDNFNRAKNYFPKPLAGSGLKECLDAISGAGVIIDGLFGTGVKGKLAPPLAKIITAVNSSRKKGAKVLAVDIPSGMDPDSGKASNVSIEADVTVTMHAPKKGLIKAKNAGKIVIADIGIPKEAKTCVGAGDFKHLLKERDEKTHKGESGRVLVIGGNENYTGAPYFSAMAALKAGCDLSYVAAPKNVASRIAQMAPDLITIPLQSEEHIGPHDVPKALGAKFDAICIGNGLGDSKESLEAARQAIAALDGRIPLVIDGDALKAIDANTVKKLSKTTILTPHAGEFKGLFGKTATKAAVCAQAKKSKCTIVLKGATDIIAQGDYIKLNKSGNPYMAKGGTGDILAGAATGFLAQGISAFWAGAFATLITGVAGDLAYIKEGRAMTASDCLSQMGTAQKALNGKSAFFYPRSK